MRMLAPALVAIASLAAAGCGERRGEAISTVPEPIPPVVAPTHRIVAIAPVSLRNYALDPANGRLRRSGYIAFQATNDGLVQHALAVDGPRGTVSTRALLPGERATIYVSLPPGRYRWYCPLLDHARRGMVGTITIAE